MNIKTFLSVVILTLLILKTYGCNFYLQKQKVGTRSEARAQLKGGKVYKRKLYYKGDNPACRCGTYDPNYPSWYLIHVNAKVLPGRRYLTCMATPVASNLLLTSHRCLVMLNENWNIIYAKRRTEAVGDVYANIAPILHWLTQDPYNPNVGPPATIKIKHIVYNPDFKGNSNTLPPDDDLAIVVTDSNLFNFGFNTLCLPKPSSDLDPGVAFYRNAIYTGTGGIFQDDPTVETRVVELVTMKAEECEKEGNFGIKHRSDTICGRFRDPAPQNAGGSLSIYGRGLTPTLYLVGLASVVGLQRNGTGINYAYFTNLIPHIAYIEEVAEKYGSLWCESKPQFIAPVELPKIAREMEIYPWEDSSQIPKRDESLDCVCGLRSEKFKSSPITRIAGGEEATKFEFPWMIMLLANPNGQGMSQCGASIINSKMILTAAHCVAFMDPQTRQNKQIDKDNIYPHFWIHEDKDLNEHMLLEPEAVYIHSDYFIGVEKAFPVIDFDIAVIILKEPLQFSSSKDIADGPVLRPICLPKMDKPLSHKDKTALISGWGLTWPIDQGGRVSPILKKIELPIQPLEDCAALTSEVLTRNMICATTYSPYHSALQGDSGSPLSFALQDGRRVQIGLTSFGLEHIKPEHKGRHLVFYTDVQRFLPFIDYFAGITEAKWCKNS